MFSIIFPTGSIERLRVPAASAAVLGRNIIVDLKPFEIRESRSGRGPMRVFASDGDGNTISLIYFNNPGWAKRSVPIGQLRTISGKLEAYGDEWQIIHPEVTEPGKGPEPAMREPVYPLTEGLTNRRLRRAGRRRRSSARPSCPNGSSRASPRAKAGARGARRSPQVHREPRRGGRAQAARL